MLLSLMEVVFQDGSSSLFKSLESPLKILISVAIPLFALWWKFRQEDKKKKEDKELHEKERLIYFQTIISLSVNPLAKQIESYRNFATRIESEPAKLHYLKRISMHDLERLTNRMDLENYFHPYLSIFGKTKEVIVEFKNIIQYIEFFYDILKENDRVAERGGMNWEENQNATSRLSVAVQNSVFDLLNNPEVRNEQQNFHRLLVNVVSDFASRNSERADKEFLPDHSFFYNNLILPLGDSVFSIEQPQTETIKPLYELVIAAKSSYDNLTSNNLDFGRSFLADAEILGTKLEEYKSNTERLRGWDFNKTHA